MNNEAGHNFLFCTGGPPGATNSYQVGVNHGKGGGTSYQKVRNLMKDIDPYIHISIHRYIYISIFSYIYMSVYPLTWVWAVRKITPEGDWFWRLWKQVWIWKWSEPPCPPWRPPWRPPWIRIIHLANHVNPTKVVIIGGNMSISQTIHMSCFLRLRKSLILLQHLLYWGHQMFHFQIKSYDTNSNFEVLDNILTIFIQGDLFHWYPLQKS